MKEPYEKPTVVKEKGISIPLKIILAGKVIICRQCSSCHGCR